MKVQRILAANSIDSYYRYRRVSNEVVATMAISRSFAATAEVSFPFEKLKLRATN